MQFTYSYCDRLKNSNSKTNQKNNFLHKSKVKDFLTPMTTNEIYSGQPLKSCNVFQIPTCFVFDYWGYLSRLYNDNGLKEKNTFLVL